MKFLQNTKQLVAIIAFGMLFAFPLSMNAQKFAYIDSEYVLLHMPEFATAQQELNSFVIQWQSEIEEKLQAADRLEVAYRVGEYLQRKCVEKRG